MDRLKLVFDILLLGALGLFFLGALGALLGIIAAGVLACARQTRPPKVRVAPTRDWVDRAFDRFLG